MRTVRGIIYFSLFIVLPVFTQDRTDWEAIDRFLVKGYDWLALEHPDSAARCFRKVLRKLPAQTDAIEGMASVEMMRGKWKRAVKWYEKILDSRPDHLPANYGAGICHREIGTTISLLARTLAWRRAEKHLNHVAGQDSMFRDVIYQLAILERYRSRFKEAIQLAEKQLSLKPYLVDVRNGLFDLYRSYIAHHDFQTSKRFLGQDSSFLKRYFLGELYRCAGRLSEADSLYRLILLQYQYSLQPVYLSRVRLAVQQGEYQEANDLYWEALEQLSEKGEVHFIRRDVLGIVHEDEYPFLKRSEKPASFKPFIKAFWLRRDPMPAAPYNQRLTEHYRRLVHVEKHYYYDGFRHWGYGGDLTRYLQFPDWTKEYHTINAMGQIYMRFGEPDETAFTLGPDVVQNMSWLYLPRGNMPKMIFHFANPRNAPPGYWTLVPLFSNREILEELIHWDMRYYSMITGTSMERASLKQELRNESRERVKQAFRMDRHSWPENSHRLEMNQSMARFIMPDSDLVQLAYAIPAEALTSHLNVRDSVQLEAGTAVFDANMNPVHKELRYHIFKKDTNKRFHYKQFIDEFEFSLIPGKYHVALHARMPQEKRLNGWQYQFDLTESDRNDLNISSLKLAYAITLKDACSKPSLKNLEILPNPKRFFQRTQPVFAYYEIYRLSFGVKAMTHYTQRLMIERKKGGRSLMDRLAAVLGLEDRYQISTETEHYGDSRTVSDFRSFDVSRLKPGVYELKVEVIDHISGEEASAMSELTLE